MIDERLHLRPAGIKLGLRREDDRLAVVVALRPPLGLQECDLRVVLVAIAARPDEEVAPTAGLANAICDLVSSGATLEANGLKEVEVIYRSKACLIQRASALESEKQALVDKLLTRIQGVQQAAESKYIMLHAPKDKLKDITALLPGVENPTILPLAQDSNKVAMHVVSQENLFWETMEQLKAIGASSILVLPIEKMME